MTTSVRMAAPRLLVAFLAGLTLVFSACGGGNDTNGGQAGNDAGSTTDEGDPVAGGSATYGVEGVVTGLCLPEAMAAISGELATMSVYDPLVYPNADGEMVPFLAESVTPNDDYTVWTIRLRDGITFHDGTPLDAETVKLNLDAYRGKNPKLRSTLFAIVYQEITDVAASDARTVVVTTKRPWVAFPSYLFLTGRVGIAAKAQLADRDSCARNLIGTGPFRLKGDWTPGTPIELERNPDYWRTDAKGQRLPYLDELTFVGVTEQSQRVNQLQGHQLQLTHTPFPSDVRKLRELGDTIRLHVADRGREVRYYMLNAGRPPFSDPDARRAFALAIDRDEINALRNQGDATLANGPFDVGVLGHIDDETMPAHDPDTAKQLVEQVKARNDGKFHVTFVIIPDANNLAEAQILQEQLKDVGITSDLERVDQPTEINRALAGDYDVLLWRLHPGEDPDTQYLWWYSTYPTNFNHFADSEIDRLLDTGRETADTDQRRDAYEELTRRFGEQLYNVWAWYASWAVATAPDVRGVLGPPLPDGSDPFPLLGGLHPTAGIWIAR